MIRRRALPTAGRGGLVAAGVAVTALVVALSGCRAAAGASAFDASAAPGAHVTSAVGTAPVRTTATAVSNTDGAAATGSRPEAAPAAVPGDSGPASPSGPGPGTPGGLPGGTTTHLVVPDVIASAAGGLTAADLGKIKKIAGVRAVLAIDGARISVNGVRLTVLAAPAAALRPWTPPTTAVNASLWSAFQSGDLITTSQAASSAHLTSGGAYPVAAAVAARITDGGTALLGVSGIDGVVSQPEGRKLGLVRNVAVLVNAPADNMVTLTGQVQAALGGGARVVRLVSVKTTTSLPVDRSPGAGRPTSYLQLFQESAADYCPGLSWTVLAAIGQIESDDGQNMGPSTAGALGPMQFLPSTWAVWGIDGFGDTGTPDIMNPFDAVPSAARLLCANGATSGGAGLRQAIFDYNHANWYVDEVLTLAAEYAREY